ncbi:RAMP superfamily CRISPR-associated protein [Candidatus Kuenenia sp.]|uniref:type III-A CRISPR-associated RAMP protein Csm4 n=1 Tax=Candidatus Kuenenia sp. TaxID=2499824 RepID=UPI0032203716
MARCRLTIKPCSPFQTPLHSDTLFGHVCWALRYLRGENELLSFLKSFSDSSAPFIISSGFPKDYIPIPVLQPLTLDEEIELWHEYRKGSQTRLEFIRDLKRFKKLPYVQISAIEILKDNLSYYQLYLSHILGKILLEDKEDEEIKSVLKPKQVEVWHNAKNRLTDRVTEGKLFAKEDTFYNEGMKLCVYIEDAYFGKNGLHEMFDFISQSGYGADKSVGRGSFNYELDEGWDLPESDNPNGFMTLSYYHPKYGDFHDGFYDISTKFGKIGGHWAAGIDGGPHKMPVLMLNPGSVFITNNQKSFYGSLIPGVHKQKDVIHYGIALPLKVRVI